MMTMIIRLYLVIMAVLLERRHTALAADVRSNEALPIGPFNPDMGAMLPGFDPASLGPLNDILSHCHVDLGSLMNTAGSALGSAMGATEPDMNFAMQALQWYRYMQDIAKSTCSSADQKSAFEAALSDFRQCAQFDLQALLENGLSAWEGTELECLLSYMAENGSTQVDGGPPTSFSLPQKCVNDLLGSNPLGDALRQFFLFPDRTMACFAQLEHTLPECVYDEAWPVPIVGQWLKIFACIVGGSSPIMDPLYKTELQALDECLAADFEDSAKAQASITPTMCALLPVSSCTNSALMGLPPPLLGAPLSDGVKRVAHDQGLMSGMKKYNTFVQVCTQPWSGWSNTAIGQPQQTQQMESATTLTAPTATADSSSTSINAGGGKSTAGAFFSGMAVSLVAVGLLAFYQQRRSKQQHQFMELNKVEYRDIELS